VGQPEHPGPAVNRVVACCRPPSLLWAKLGERAVCQFGLLQRDRIIAA
jgi:hypothetical protein